MLVPREDPDPRLAREPAAAKARPRGGAVRRQLLGRRLPARRAVSELDHALIVGWPLALTVAAFLVRERVRGGRRRGALNRALHELRRPLQALALGADDGSRDGRLGERRRPRQARARARGARRPRPRAQRRRAAAPSAARSVPDLGRGRVGPVAGRGGALRLAGRVALAGGIGDRARRSRRLAQALDNLIVNAIEHGGPPIRVRGACRQRRCGSRSPTAGAGRLRPTRRARGRRGHGLEVVARVAAQHGGRFMVSHGRRRTVAALELPLAERPAVAELPAAG